MEAAAANSSCPADHILAPNKLSAAAECDARLTGIRLTSNGGDIKDVAWLEPTSTNASAKEIGSKYNRDGYVYVKGLLPVDVVRKMRRKYFEFVASSGLLKEGTDPVEGIYCGAAPDEYAGPATAATAHGESNAGQFMKLATEAYCSDFYEEFQNTPELFEFAKRLTGWDKVHLLKRQLLRTNVPGAEATGVHYDQIFLRAGPPTALTAWVPIGRVTAEGGGLIYLERSHELGKQIEDEFQRRAVGFTQEQRLSAYNANMMRGGILASDAGGFAKMHGRRWLIADYEDGDVVFHNPFMIHASAVNQSPEGRIRLSTDLRFVHPDLPFDTRWMNSWSAGDGL